MPTARLAVLLACALVSCAYSALYTVWRLPPQLPFGTFGLVLAGDVLPLLVVPLAVLRFALREPPRAIGWARPGPPGVWRSAGLAYAAVLPLVLLLAFRPEFPAYYPSRSFPPAREHAVGLVFLWVLHHGPQLLAQESMWRGTLFLPLARRAGPLPAGAAAAALSVALHWGKPPLELLLAGWGAVVFLCAAWRTGSFLPAFAAHWLVAVTMDALCFARLRGWP